MIVFDLSCSSGGHRFEGWFGSSEDFASQHSQGLVACPKCGSTDVGKAPMAPNVGRKGNQMQPAAAPAPARVVNSGQVMPAQIKAMQALHAIQTEILKQSEWVGSDFAEQSRAMHYGERESGAIHGEATLEQARELIEEGIEVAPLPFPVTPKRKSN